MLSVFFCSKTKVDLVSSLATSTELTAAPVAGTLFSGTCFVDIQRAFGQIITVQCIDCFVSFIIVVHFHETESLGSTCFPVSDNVNGVDIIMHFEFFAEIVFRGPVRQITYINLHLSNTFSAAGP